MRGTGMKVGLAAGMALCRGQAGAGAGLEHPSAMQMGVHLDGAAPTASDSARDAGTEAEIAAAPSLAADVRVIAKAAISTRSGEPKEDLIQ